MKRRNLLKTIGGITTAATVGGAGIFALSGGAAASKVNITANNAAVSNDDGDVKEVLIDPSLTVNWSDFDDAVGAVSIFIEARVNGNENGPNEGGYYPIHRSEPVLLPGGSTGMNAVAPSTSGTFEIGPFSNLEENRADGDSWSAATSDDGDLRIADAEFGAPDYESATQTLDGQTFDYDNADAYFNGGNVYGATIPDFSSMEHSKLVNGEYGAASGTGVFEASTEGASNTTTVDLRYTIQLLELGLGHFQMITGYNVVEKADDKTVGAIRDELADLHDATNEEWDSDVLNNAGHLSDVQPEDITVVSSRTGGNGYTEDEDTKLYGYETNQKLLAMGDLDGNDNYPKLPFGTSRDAKAVRDYNDTNNHPAIITAEPSFDVTVTNEASGNTLSGSSNGGVN